MDYNIGDIVISKAGRDKDSFLVVMDMIDDDKLLLADGKLRKAENPKKKKIKHVHKINAKSSLIYDKIMSNEKISNALIRKELERIKEEI